MKKRSFLLPLATALTALVGLGAPGAQASLAAPTETASIAEPGVKLPESGTSDLVIERSSARGQKFAQHRSHGSHGSHGSHSSHSSHYSSR